jgi:DNA replication protein DnaC
VEHARPACKTLEGFDFGYQASVQKTIVLHIGQLDFGHLDLEQLDILAARDNVIFLGPPGTGKTHLAIALGLKACLAGSRTLFASATTWVTRLAAAEREHRLDRYLGILDRWPLSIVDEVGCLPFDANAASLFFQLVNARDEHGSLIVTSNKPFTAWGEVVGDPVVAAAMLDRLVHHAEILSLKEDSSRLKDKRLGPTLKPRAMTV